MTLKGLQNSELTTMLEQQIIIVGGGFYGTSIAEYLARKGASVTLVEREHELLLRASYNNQARLHGGYHYPRSFGTAYRSRLNFRRFIDEFQPAIKTDFVKLYAISRVDSKVNARQFQAFCRNIEAPLRPARRAYTELFSHHLIEAVYETEEFVFDAAVLRCLMRERIQQAGVKVLLGRKVLAVKRDSERSLHCVCDDGSFLKTDRVFNCTYSGLNTIQGISPTHHNLKQEITEMALIELPKELEGLSVTVMDGPFFSFMPFPDRKLATLSHVRYTPHASWMESIEGVLDPYSTLDEFDKCSRFEHMVRDAGRYLPILRRAIYHDSLFEVKTVLMKNELDDGRPILFEADPKEPRIISVLGSKIDNIFDALAAVETVIVDDARNLAIAASIPNLEKVKVKEPEMGIGEMP
jgi:glycine/D-amino acid oxidase-like deaminating enzyme